MVNYCPSCGFKIDGYSSDQLSGNKTVPFEFQKPKRQDDIDDEIDNQVVRKTVIKKKLSEKQINALAESRKKMALKRAEAKQLKESGENLTKTEIKKVEDENVKVDEARKEKNKEFVATSYRRKLF